jgi:hypothetical protein
MKSTTYILFCQLAMPHPSIVKPHNVSTGMKPSFLRRPQLTRNNTGAMPKIRISERPIRPITLTRYVAPKPIKNRNIPATPDPINSPFFYTETNLVTPQYTMGYFNKNFIALRRKLLN